MQKELNSPLILNFLKRQSFFQNLISIMVTQVTSCPRHIMEEVSKKYSAAMIWNEIRPKHDKRDWHRLLWTSLYIPRHAIVSWMAILNKLPTLDRMISWGLVIDGNCKLC